MRHGPRYSLHHRLALHLLFALWAPSRPVSRCAVLDNGTRDSIEGEGDWHGAFGRVATSATCIECRRQAYQAFLRRAVTSGGGPCPNGDDM